MSDVHPLKRTTVLVVEDDHDLRASFRTCLALAGFLVREAPDGIHALRQIDQQPPDLVVLDLMLPNLSGLDVQQEIASNAYTRAIPIVVVTGPRSISTISWCRAFFGSRSADELVTAVQRCLTRRPPEFPF